MNELELQLQEVCQKIYKVVYINLDHRTDRKESIVNELQKVFSNDKIIRFDAVKDTTHGGIGCTKSHIDVVKMAMEQNWENVLIVEDDMVWKNNTEEGFVTLHKLLEQSYDVIVLGGQKLRFDKKDKTRLINSLTTTAYVVSRHYYEILLNNFEEGLNKFVETKNYHLCAIDQHWNILQRQHNWKGIVPSLCLQTPSYSDIMNKSVHYTNFS